MPIVYIIRYAPKEQGDFYNTRLRHPDEPISQMGQEEARKLWLFLCDKEISASYVSSYQRRRQTIEHVAKQSGITPIIDERLNEIDNGCIEGLTDAEIHQGYPEVWREFHERSADFRFPGGETGEEAQCRIMEFLEEKRQTHGTENIVLVSHDGWMRLLVCYIMHIPVYRRWDLHVETCGIMEITYQPDYQSWKLIRFNQKLL